MKLILENFRCYKSHTFDLPDSGVTLIHGDSGKGKTSIFKAIHFVLYNKELRTTTFGAKKSKVELHLSDCVIVRTRTPNHLTVTTSTFQAEDSVAQAWIDKVFGKQFQQTSYLSQKCLDNFFTLKREERAEMLRNLTIQSFDVDKLKAQNKDNVKVRKANLQKASLNYRYVHEDMVNRKFSTEQEPKEPVFPLQLRDNMSTFEDAIKEEQRQQEHNQKKLTQASTTLKENIDRLDTLMGETNQRFVFEQRLSELEDKLREISKRLVTSVVVDESKVKECKTHLQQLELYEHIQEKQQQRDKARDEANAQKQADIQAIDDELQNVHYDEEEHKAIEDEIEYLQQASKTYQTIVTLWNRLKQTTKQPRDINEFAFKTQCHEALHPQYWCIEASDKNAIQELSQEIAQKQTQISDLKKQVSTSTYKCPCCKAGLAFIDRQIVKHDVERLKGELRETLLNLQELEERLQHAQGIEKQNEKQAQLHKELCYTIERLEESLEEDVESIPRDLKRAQNELKTQLGERDKLHALKLKRNEITKREPEVVKYLEKELIGLLAKLTLARVDNLASEKQRVQKQLIYEEEKLAQARFEASQQREWSAQKHELERQCAELQAKLKNCSESNLDELRKSIQALNVDIDQRNQKAERFNKRKVAIDEWRRSYETFVEHSRLFKKRRDALQEMNVCERALRVALQFSQMIVDSESLALQTFLVQLNEECSRHMQVMFEDSLSLRVTYENTHNVDDDNKKFFVDVQLSRNGEDVPFDTLSGGESDRCALVLFLAFNKLSKSRMLLLDECLSSLHAESVEDIVDHIKKEFVDKVCILTLHQTTQGIFDQIVTL